LVFFSQPKKSLICVSKIQCVEARRTKAEQEVLALIAPLRKLIVMH